MDPNHPSAKRSSTSWPPEQPIYLMTEKPFKECELLINSSSLSPPSPQFTMDILNHQPRWFFTAFDILLKAVSSLLITIISLFITLLHWSMISVHVNWTLTEIFIIREKSPPLSCTLSSDLPMVSLASPLDWSGSKTLLWIFLVSTTILP